MASLALIPSPAAVVHPIARLSPWFSLDSGEECLRSFSSARIWAHSLASMDIFVLFWTGGEKCTDRSSLWLATMSSINWLSETILKYVTFQIEVPRNINCTYNILVKNNCYLPSFFRKFLLKGSFELRFFFNTNHGPLRVVGNFYFANLLELE